MLDDGTPPPEPVVIERVCNGRAYPEAYTDTKGRFSFRVGEGNNIAAMGDASVSGAAGGLGPPGSNVGGFGGNDPFNNGRFGGRGLGGDEGGFVDLTGCDLRARLAGFRSEEIYLGRRSVFDRSDVGTIILHRLAKVEGDTVSATTLAAPKKARKAYDKAVKRMSKGDPNPEKAIELLNEAVAEHPKFAAAWTMLGQLRMGRNDPKGAREAFARALEADSMYLSPYLPLIRLELQERNWEKAAELSERLLRLNPNRTEAQYYQAVAKFNSGDPVAAEEAALDLQSNEGGKRYPQTHHLLGLIYANRGDYPKAAAQMRTFLSAQPEAPQAEDIRRKLHEWEVLGVIEENQ